MGRRPAPHTQTKWQLGHLKHDGQMAIKRKKRKRKDNNNEGPRGPSSLKKKEKRQCLFFIWPREEKWRGEGRGGDFSFPPHKNCDPRRSNGPIFDPSSET
jgi:hypothetical protein